MAKMVVVKVDYENNAHEYARSGGNPTFTRVFDALEQADEIEVARGEIDAFLEVARGLPGWDDGPAWARHPLLLEGA